MKAMAVLCFVVCVNTGLCLKTGLCASLHVDSFDGGDDLGWQGDGPTVIPTGGPGGDNDSYLQIVATGSNGPGSRAAAFNETRDWTGDIGVIGATAIEFDMANFQSADDLDMRIVLFGPESTGNRWTSTESQLIPNDGLWRRYSFSLDETALTRVQGSAAYDEVIADVVRVMFRHDRGAPSSRGTAVSATLGVDNISLVGVVVEPLRCDFDNNGQCGIADIDSLMQNVASGENDPAFDLNGDQVVNDFDRDAWLVQAGSANGLAGAYLLGDANLDGGVNVQDLNALAVNWQTENANWSGGNFTNAGSNVADLNALALNWQQSTPTGAAAAVPEPARVPLWTLLFLMAVLRSTRPRPHAS